MRSCFFLLNGDLKVVYSSPPVENVLGGSPYLYSNMPFLDLIHPEERETASQDFSNFLKAKTLYGTSTRCRAFNTKNQEFVVVNIYSNVVSDNLIYASVIKSTELLNDKSGGIANEETKQANLEEVEKLKDCLNKLERDQPTPAPVNPDDSYYTRVLVFYDSEKLECKLIWPSENFLRLTSIPAEAVSSHTLESDVGERPPEIVSFVNDVRSVQKLDNAVTKRFCTIHHIIGQDSRRRCLESVLEVQGDLTIILSELRSDRTPVYLNSSTENATIPRRMVPIDAKVGPLRVRQKYCQMCGTGDSPEWRKGPHGERTLCNACGLRYSRSLKKKVKDSNRDKTDKTDTNVKKL